MSAESPRNNGTGESIPHQQPEGGSSRFFRRLFAVLPTISGLQPPLGLENFAAKIQQGITNHLVTARQQEIDRRNRDDILIAAETKEKAIAAQNQK